MLNAICPSGLVCTRQRSITIALQEVEVARPLTHDLLKNVFKPLNAQILRVEVVSAA